jgi:hypothetical protein
VSWTCSIPEVPVGEMATAIDAAVPDPAELSAGPKAQFEAAKVAARALDASGSVGHGQLPVTMRIEGHYSDDPSQPSTVTVQVLELAPTLADLEAQRLEREGHVEVDGQLLREQPGPEGAGPPAESPDAAGFRAIPQEIASESVEGEPTVEAAVAAEEE